MLCLCGFELYSRWVPLIQLVIKLSSRRFRNFIICRNLCVVLFLALYSIRHFTWPVCENVPVIY